MGHCFRTEKKDARARWGVGEGGGNGAEESVGQRREPGGDRGDRWCRGNAPGAARAPEPGKATAEDIRALYNLTNIAEGKAPVRAIGDRQVAEDAARNHPGDATIQEGSGNLIKWGEL
jgi:hypothetical protein